MAASFHISSNSSSINRAIQSYIIWVIESTVVKLTETWRTESKKNETNLAHNSKQSQYGNAAIYHLNLHFFNRKVYLCLECEALFGDAHFFFKWWSILTGRIVKWNVLHFVAPSLRFILILYFHLCIGTAKSSMAHIHCLWLQVRKDSSFKIPSIISAKKHCDEFVQRFQIM
jgi:hypothetical protein